jgi:hypothetical protein
MSSIGEQWVEPPRRQKWSAANCALSTAAWGMRWLLPRGRRRQRPTHQRYEGSSTGSSLETITVWVS